MNPSETELGIDFGYGHFNVTLTLHCEKGEILESSYSPAIELFSMNKHISLRIPPLTIFFCISYLRVSPIPMYDNEHCCSLLPPLNVDYYFPLKWG